MLDVVMFGFVFGLGEILFVKYDFFVGGLKLGNIDLSVVWID